MYTHDIIYLLYISVIFTQRTQLMGDGEGVFFELFSSKNNATLPAVFEEPPHHYVEADKVCAADLHF